MREDGARLMEASIKTPVVQAAVAIAGFMAFLAEFGAERDIEEQAKTRWALQYYADKMRKARAGRAGNTKNKSREGAKKKRKGAKRR